MFDYNPAQDQDIGKASNNNIINLKKEGQVLPNGNLLAKISYLIPYNELPSDVVSWLSSLSSARSSPDDIPSAFFSPSPSSSNIAYHYPFFLTDPDKKQELPQSIRSSSITSLSSSVFSSSPAIAITPIVDLQSFGKSLLVVLSIEAMDNLMDADSQMSTLAGYTSRIQRLNAIQYCINNPILRDDPTDREKIQKDFEETVTEIKFNAIASLFFGAGQGTLFGALGLPPLVNIALDPFFNAEAQVFDEISDREIEHLSKSVGDCTKKKQPTKPETTPELNLPPVDPEVPGPPASVGGLQNMDKTIHTLTSGRWTTDENGISYYEPDRTPMFDEYVGSGQIAKSQITGTACCRLHPGEDVLDHFQPVFNPLIR
jgi:hypothetical protein